MARQPRAEWDPARGRNSAEFKQAAKELLVPGALCWLDGLPIRFDVPPRHPMSGSIDHVTPLSRGGHPTARENLRPAHYGCNSGRGNRDPKLTPVRRSRAW